MSVICSIKLSGSKMPPERVEPLLEVVQSLAQGISVDEGHRSLLRLTVPERVTEANRPKAEGQTGEGRESSGVVGALPQNLGSSGPAQQGGRALHSQLLLVVLVVVAQQVQKTMHHQGFCFVEGGATLPLYEAASIDESVKEVTTYVPLFGVTAGIAFGSTSR